MKKILVLNSGSSSLKYALFNVTNGVLLKNKSASGTVEKIGQNSQIVKHSYTNTHNGETEKISETNDSLSTHTHALKHVLRLLSRSFKCSISELNVGAVGHRVVHGGESLKSAQIINPRVMELIEEASTLAPLHNPSNLLGIKTAVEMFPSYVPHVAAFDTAFHSSVPKHAHVYGVPYHLYTDHHVRKYGFHGTSHEFVAKEAATFMQRPLDSLRLITCHLGAGASVSCIENGKSIDHSMGMTPMSGLLMQTRCGDLDPSVIFHLINRLKMSPDEVEYMLLKESGWFGLSGIEDARQLEDSFLDQEVISERTITAVECMVHRIRGYLGNYMWQLGGHVDAVVFTGGVGENWPSLRKLCFTGAEGFGFEVDDEVNDRTIRVGSIVDVSAVGSERRILVIPTDEEYSIAETTWGLVNSHNQI